MAAFTRKKYTVRHRTMPGFELLHPGDYLTEAFLEPLGMSATDLARATGMHATHAKALAYGRTRLTTEDAFRLARYFGQTIDFWLNLQEAYEVQRFERSPLFANVAAIQPHPKQKGELVNATSLVKSTYRRKHR